PHARPGRTGHGVDVGKKDSLDVTITDHAEWADLVERLLAAVFPRLIDYARRRPALVCGALAPSLVDRPRSAQRGISPACRGEARASRLHGSSRGPHADPLAPIDPATRAPVPLDLERVAALDDDALGEVLQRLYRPGRINVQRYERGRGGYHHWHSEVMPL